MPDGLKRARRNGTKGEARRKWYAYYRNLRFARRFMGTEFNDSNIHNFAIN